MKRNQPWIDSLNQRDHQKINFELTVSAKEIIDSTSDERNENSNSNLKTLFYKDFSLGSVKNLSNNQSLLSYWWLDIRDSERERDRVGIGGSKSQTDHQ